MKAPKRGKGRAAAKAETRRRNLLIFGGIGVVVLAIVVILIVRGNGGTSGTPLPTGSASSKYQEETYPEQGREHIPRGSAHAPYSSNPPTSGPHYGDKMVPVPEGFYDESDMQVDEDLVHSMEHGYVIIWYDCTKAPNGNCDALKASIKQLMGSVNGGYHLIANPRNGQMETMIALTSWTKLQRFDAWDPDAIKAFISRNFNQAPEPGGP